MYILSQWKKCQLPGKRKKKRQTITSVGKDVEKLEPLHIADGNVKYCNSLAVPQKVKHGLSTWPSNSTPGRISERTESTRPYKHLHKNIHSNIIHSSQKIETTQMSINWWMNKQNMVYPYMECYLALKRNEVLIHATTWIKLESIMLNGRSQTQKATCYIMPFI